MTGPAPVRTCVGCRERAPRSQLVRFVAGPAGPEPGQHQPGRGAWLHADEECARQAVRRGGLARALRLDRPAVDRRADLVLAEVAARA